MTDTITCEDTQDLLQIWLDGELDPNDADIVSNHVSGCESCRVATRKLELLRLDARTALTVNTPSRLQERIVERLPSKQDQVRWSTFGWPVLTHLAAAMLGALAVALVASSAPEPNAGSTFIAAHVRQQLALQDKDAQSADTHVLKPWLATQLSYAVPVRSPSPDEFPMLGASIDIVDFNRVAAVRYRRRRHNISLFVYPSSRSVPMGDLSERGYNAYFWSADGFMYWLISDLNQRELSLFAQQLGVKP